ncbi:glycosyltransferase [Geoglobus acetivorans]|uniref:Glycosyltransferase n=1 Tax=Geoglobus acetivorans TaxID=565033 RepID=A0ABZ3H4M6_GEOAI|nr:glycosyltransferase [Geoglobus acetivorans]
MISSYPTEGCGVSKYTERFIKESVNVKLCLYTQRIYAYESYFRSIFRWINAAKDILHLKPDIVHVQYTPTICGLFFPFFLILIHIFRKIKKIKTKIVITAHEKPSTYIVNIRVKFLINLFMFYEKIIYTLSDLILVHTREHLQEICSIYTVAREKCRTIEYGISTTDNTIAKSLKNKFSIKRDIKLTFFGIVRPSRGIDTLIKAFSVALRYNPNLKLNIAGKVPDKFMKYYMYLQSLVKQLGVENKVIFKGFIPDEDVSLLFEESDIIILPYRKSTQSEVLHQAIIHMKPVIVSDIGGIGETVKRFKIGITCPVDDIRCFSSAILMLSENKKLLTKYKYNTKKAIMVKSWKKLLKRYMETYKELVRDTTEV